MLRLCPPLLVTFQDLCFFSELFCLHITLAKTKEERVQRYRLSLKCYFNILKSMRWEDMEEDLDHVKKILESWGKSKSSEFKVRNIREKVWILRKQTRHLTSNKEFWLLCSHVALSSSKGSTSINGFVLSAELESRHCWLSLNTGSRGKRLAWPCRMGVSCWFQNWL